MDTMKGLVLPGNSTVEFKEFPVPEPAGQVVKLGIVDKAFLSGTGTLQDIMQATDNLGAEVSIDCSGHPDGRLLSIQGTRQWGRCAFVGEGGSVSFEPSRDIIHKQITIYGSWVTSLGNLEDLVEKLVRWKLHPEVTVTQRFPLDRAAEAYRIMDEGKCGKVVITYDDQELKFSET